MDATKLLQDYITEFANTRAIGFANWLNANYYFPALECEWQNHNDETEINYGTEELYTLYLETL